VACTIGVLVIDLEGTYSKMLWPSIAATLQSRGHDCLIIPANNPRYPYDFLYQYNHLFNFIRPDIIDALILVPNTIMNFIDTGEALDMISRIRRNVPIVSMNHLIEGAPSVLINHAKGIQEAVQHFVQYHGYRRIGFVEGPPDNTENIQRKTAFVDAMAEYGIEVGGNCFFEANFTRTKASHLADEMGKRWVEEYDALFTANDYTAVGIIASLQRQGYHVPRDLAVIGFDNIGEAPYLNPPLSSVMQPFAAMTEAAANTAADLCEGKDVSPVVRFDTALVRRASCGCEHFMNSELQGYWQPGYVEAKAASGFSEFLKDGAGFELSEKTVSVCTSLLSVMEKETPDVLHAEGFLHEFESLVDTEMFEHGSFPDWYMIVLHLFLYARQRFPRQVQEWEELRLSEKMFMLISRKHEVWIGYKNQRWQDEVYARLQGIQQSLAMVPDLYQMADMVSFIVGWLGMENCFISMLRRSHKRRGLYSTLPAYSRLILAVVDGERDHDITVDEPLEFETMNLWPDKLKPSAKGKVWTVLPLFSRDELYGFMINEIKKLNGVFTVSLGRQIAAIVQRSRIEGKRKKAEEKLQVLLKELEKRNKKLTQDSLIDELTGLYNRRGFMLEAQSVLDANRDRHTGFCLYFADMDGLKFINDNYGHPEGDRAIKDMAKILSSVFREEDIIARLGGDEFTILAFDVKEGFEDLISSRLSKETQKYQAQESRLYILSLSIGSAFGYSDQKKLRLEEVMKKADDRLYALRRKRKAEQS
ncbi:MAG: GGDEF domain-containing protein, partial [Spirochaetales bacterium]|nr:GGDEF domain-containing protein [Spirochaetales bacterium]